MRAANFFVLLTLLIVASHKTARRDFQVPELVTESSSPEKHADEVKADPKEGDGHGGEGHGGEGHGGKDSGGEGHDGGGHGGEGHGDESHGGESHGKSIHGHHAPDAETWTASMMLIGGVTLLMMLFFLVQHEDTDIRFQTWHILTLSACIFIAVIASKMIKQLFIAHVFATEHGSWGKVGICLSLAVCWIIATQLVLALLSGGFGEEAKDPKDAENKEEREELEKSWERRELSMQCWGGLMAHCAGFSVVFTLSSLQDVKPFNTSPLMATLAVPISIVVTSLLFRVVKYIRYKINLSDDGKVSRGEALWEEMSAEAEDEALCLGLSFALTRALNFFAIGQLHDTHFHVHDPADFESGWIITLVMSLMFLAMGLGTFLLKQILFPGAHADSNDDAPGHDEPQEEKGDIRERALNITTQTFVMSFAWGLLACAIFMLNAHLSKYEGHLLGSLLIALLTTMLSVVMLLVLDKVADSWKTQQGAEGILNLLDRIVAAFAILVGVSWELCFTASMRAIGYYFNELVVGVFLCLLVAPPYRFFMLPELAKRKDKALAEIAQAQKH
eukprot:TRINITY_DN14833_c0_g1_i2.p1 TRINITY_DN14833_c0_g1~~TRINITY_DN14833_c0_g1_i2.p1  ORF type:complete len:560 (-),score=119.75 TRINITY_DN14833_c0_g1_i2:65-1744(-)